MTEQVEGPLDYWAQKWAKDDTGWHKTYINPFIEKHYEDITQGDKVKILFPLCGKAIDMKWMAEKGHDVVGVEGVSKACEEFFKEQNMQYTVKKNVPGWNGSLYQSRDEKVKIYCGDVFNFNSSVEGGFTAVWDRGSYVAICSEDRDRYIELMTQDGLLDPQCRYFLETFQYDPSKHPGPPNFIPEEEILQNFDSFSAQKLSQRDYNEGLFMSKGIPCVVELRKLVWQKH